MLNTTFLSSHTVVVGYIPVNFEFAGGFGVRFSFSPAGYFVLGIFSPSLLLKFVSFSPSDCIFVIYILISSFSLSILAGPPICCS